MVAKEQSCCGHEHPVNPPAYMLPNCISPVHYDLNILVEHVYTSSIDNESYVVESNDEGGNCGVIQGSTNIYCVVNKPTPVIKLHAVDLQFTSSSCFIVSFKEEYDGRPIYKEKSILVEKVTYDTEQQTASFILSEPLPCRCNVLLHFEYKTFIHSKNFRGIYACKFNKEPKEDTTYVSSDDDEMMDGKSLVSDPDTPTVNGFVTHFEPCDARRAFPCFDEPATKATFQLELTVPAHLMALSNTPIISQEEVDINSSTSSAILKMKRFKFEKTPKMSCYLIAWFVGLFDYIEETIELKGNNGGHRKLPIRVYTPLGMAEQGRFSLQVAVDAVKLYSEKFNSPFCMPKLDIVSVSILDALAMENFGLLVFRERYLLVNERTSIRLKQRIARLICHEIGHQWFGNLVSIGWWKYLWLKEGFARFLEYALVTTFFPHWNYWTHFESDIYVRALEMDEENYTHPVECLVTNATEIQTIFDSISYGKGASIFRMLIHFIGEDIMWKGLEHFLHQHEFSHAKTEDLWRSFSQVSGLDIGALMDGWVKFSGHPVIVVSEINTPSESNTNMFQLEQFVCTKNGASDIAHTKAVDPNGYSEYNVPIRIKSSNSAAVQSTIMKEHKTTISMPIGFTKDDPKSWVKFNFGHTGFYRVNYSPNMWKRLADAVARNELSVEDSLGLLLDAFALIRYPSSHKAHMSIDSLFQLLLAFQNCTDYQIWLYITQQLQSLLPLMNEQNYIVKMRMFVCELYSEINTKMGLFNVDSNFGRQFLQHKHNSSISDDELSEDYLKSLIVSLLAMCEHKPTIQMCLDLFQTHINPMINFSGKKLLASLKQFNIDNLMTSMAIALREGGVHEYNIARKIFYATKSEPEIQKQCFKALWETQSADLIRQNIEILFTYQDMVDDFIYSVGSLIARNSIARREVWKEIITIATREVQRYKAMMNSPSSNSPSSPDSPWSDGNSNHRSSRHPMFYPMTVTLLSNLKFNCGNIQFLQDYLMVEIDVLRHFINEKGLSAMLHTVHQNCKWVYENAVTVDSYLSRHRFTVVSVSTVK